MERRALHLQLDNVQAKIQDRDKTTNKHITIPRNKVTKIDNISSQTGRAVTVPEEISNNLSGGICIYNLQNKTEYDLLIKLLRNDNKERLVYVPSGKEYPLQNLPEGKYKIKYGYGIGWEAKKKRFKKNIEYKIWNSPMELKIEEIRTLRDGDIIRTKVCKGGMIFSVKDTNDNNATGEDIAIPSSEF